MNPTTETLVPYKRHPLGFDCPVRVQTVTRYSKGQETRTVAMQGKVALPERENGRLVYALPGGGRWCP